MPAPVPTAEQMRAAVEAVQEHGSIRKAAAALKMPHTTVQARVERAQREGMADAAPDALRLRRAEKEAEDLRRKLRDAQDAVLDRDGRIATLTSLKAARPAQLRWTMPAPAVRRRTTLFPLLMTSDFQTGEVIKARELEGMNAYSAEVFAARYRLMIERVIDCATHHTGAAEFPGFHYLRLGDVISGSIHDDLAETNDLSAVPALKLVFQCEREGIRLLRERFGRVRVLTVNGNHDRLTHKPRTKNTAELSIGTVLAWWLEMAFEGDANVTFQASPSPDLMFECAGWNVLMSHGDRMGSKGGGGFIGPEAAIIRGHHQLFKNWSDGGQRPDLILTGHFHTQVATVRGFANGSLAGYSEFARDLRAIPDAARQWLLFMHDRRKVSQAFGLQLSELPRRKMLQEAA